MNARDRCNWARKQGPDPRALIKSKSISRCAPVVWATAHHAVTQAPRLFTSRGIVARQVKEEL